MSINRGRASKLQYNYNVRCKNRTQIFIRYYDWNHIYMNKNQKGVKKTICMCKEAEGYKYFLHSLLLDTTILGNNIILIIV